MSLLYKTEVRAEGKRAASSASMGATSHYEQCTDSGREEPGPPRGDWRVWCVCIVYPLLKKLSKRCIGSAFMCEILTLLLKEPRKARVSTVSTTVRNDGNENHYANLYFVNAFAVKDYWSLRFRKVPIVRFRKVPISVPESTYLGSRKVPIRISVH